MAKKKETVATENFELDEKDILRDLAENVNKALKSNSIMVGDACGDESVPYWVLTGIPQLDYAVGGYRHPGFPGARITEIFGGESTGKSTLSVWLMKQSMEQLGAIACYQDAERVLTDEIIKGTGINMNKVLREQPDTIEEVFNSQEALLDILKEKYPDKPVSIILDSIAACSTKAEIEGDMESQQMGGLARYMGKGLRKLKKPITDSKALSIWVNQTREKLGVVFGDNTTTSGGKAMAFFASVRIKLRKKETLKKSGSSEPYGCKIEASIIKNKVAKPMCKAEYDILFINDEKGSYPILDVEGAILDWCKDHGIIEGSVGRYEINGKKLYKDAARKELKDNPELFKELKEKVYSVSDGDE